MVVVVVVVVVGRVVLRVVRMGRMWTLMPHIRTRIVTFLLPRFIVIVDKRFSCTYAQCSFSFFSMHPFSASGPGAVPNA